MIETYNARREDSDAEVELARAYINFNKAVATVPEAESLLQSLIVLAERRNRVISEIPIFFEIEVEEGSVKSRLRSLAKASTVIVPLLGTNYEVAYSQVNQLYEVSIEFSQEVIEDLMNQSKEKEIPYEFDENTIVRRQTRFVGKLKRIFDLFEKYKISGGSPDVLDEIRSRLLEMYRKISDPKTNEMLIQFLEEMPSGKDILVDTFGPNYQREIVVNVDFDQAKSFCEVQIR